VLFRAKIAVPPDADSFRTVAPYFANKTVYPDATIDFWMSVAETMLPSCRWVSLYGAGVVLFTAHNLYLQALNLASEGPGGTPGQARGLVASESAGSVSVSYDNQAATEEGAGHWNRSIWGQEFIRLARLVGSGPLQVNVPPWGTGFCPPALDTTALAQSPLAGSVGPGWANPQENVPVGKWLPRGGSGGGLLPLLLFAVMILAGCRHTLIVVNAGIANKTAAGLGAMSPETYCLALTASNIRFRGRPAPALSQQQVDFCRDVLAPAKGATP
jgi:hypothetical protein